MKLSHIFCDEPRKAFALGLAIATTGIYVAAADDAPGAAWETPRPRFSQHPQATL